MQMKIRIPSSQGFSQLLMCIVLEATIGTILMQNRCCSPYLKIIDLPLNLAGGLPLYKFLGSIDYAKSTMQMQLKMRHPLCWNAPSTTPIKIGSLPSFR